MSKKYIKLDTTHLTTFKELLPLVSHLDERSASPEGVPLYGSLPLDEIFLAAAKLKTFENAEPTHNGPDLLKKTPFTKPVHADISSSTSPKQKPGLMHPHHVRQGRNGNCWFLSAIIAILAKPSGDKFISSMYRDLSQPLPILPHLSRYGGATSLGKALGLKNDNVILVRWFDESSNPQYVLVDKSIVNGNFRSQAPLYVQMLEKAYIGHFLKGDYKQADGAAPETLFNAFAGGQVRKTIELDISKTRKKHVEEFGILLNKEMRMPTDLISEIFNHDKALIETFKKFRNVAGLGESKEPLTPNEVINFAEKAAEQIGSTTKGFEKLEPMMNCLKQYALSLNDDKAYRPIFAKRLEELFTKISSSPLSDSKDSKVALTNSRPAIVVFDAKKIIARKSASGGSDEPISDEGFIGKHGFAVSHIGEMTFQHSAESKTSEKQTVVHLVNPWGHTGVAQVYSDESKGLTQVKTKSNVSIVTIDDLINWGKEITYDPGMSFLPEHLGELSQNAMTMFGGYKQATPTSSPEPVPEKPTEAGFIY